MIHKFFFLQLTKVFHFLHRAVLTTTGSGRSYSIIRPYTPISDPNAKGYCDLMVKFYPEGIMSRHIAQLKPGDTLEVNG
jgi:cytochrome-b5 reductase